MRRENIKSNSWQKVKRLSWKEADIRCIEELQKNLVKMADMEKKVEIYESIICRSSTIQLTQSLQSLNKEFETHDGKQTIFSIQ